MRRNYRSTRFESLDEGRAIGALKTERGSESYLLTFQLRHNTYDPAETSTSPTLRSFAVLIFFSPRITPL